MAQLLLIDDDPDLIAEQVRQAFPSPRHRVAVAATGAEGIKSVAAAPPDVILLDLRLPDQSGLDVYQQIRRIDARIPVIFITLAKSADAAIEAMKQGAYDYLFKPLDLHQVRRVVGEALEVARRRPAPAPRRPCRPPRPGEQGRGTPGAPAPGSGTGHHRRATGEPSCTSCLVNPPREPARRASATSRVGMPIA